mmetsp:Transcript_60908/g.157007  ORF Transcript_60908/g.157007 Transcript_60908/m.157007 type:complete len:377 (-) Transcript_60908:2045-3175(-)
MNTGLAVRSFLPATTDQIPSMDSAGDKRSRRPSLYSLVPHNEVRIDLVVVVHDELTVGTADLLPVPQDAVELSPLASCFGLVAAWVAGRVHLVHVVYPSERDPADEDRIQLVLIRTHVLVTFGAALREVQTCSEKPALARKAHVKVVVRDGVGRGRVGAVKHQTLVGLGLQLWQVGRLEDLRTHACRCNVATPTTPCLVGQGGPLPQLTRRDDLPFALAVRVPRLRIPHFHDFLHGVALGHASFPIAGDDALPCRVEELLELCLKRRVHKVNLPEHLVLCVCADQVLYLPARRKLLHVAQFVDGNIILLRQVLVTLVVGLLGEDQGLPHRLLDAGVHGLLQLGQCGELVMIHHPLRHLHVQLLAERHGPLDRVLLA